MVDEKRFKAGAFRTAVLQVDVTGKTSIVVQVRPDDISSFISPVFLNEDDSEHFGFSHGGGFYSAAPFYLSPANHAYDL